MSEVIVAKRYAEALFLIGVEQNAADLYAEELTTVLTVYENNTKLNAFLLHPQVSIVDKEELINNIFTGVSEQVLHTLLLLVRRERMTILPFITKEYIANVDMKNSLAKLEVYSVTALTDAQNETIRTTFKQRLNKREIIIQNITDPKLIGGIKVRYGNTVFDGSVSNKLERLERRISTVNY